MKKKFRFRSSVPGGELLMGFKGTKVEKETTDFIQYLVSQEINSKYCQEALFISPRKDSGDLNYAFGICPEKAPLEVWLGDSMLSRMMSKVQKKRTDRKIHILFASKDLISI